jgi:hypothetical protein
MASQLLRSSLRAIARPSLVKSFVAPNVARRVPNVVAFNATRSFSASFTHMSTGVGKVYLVLKKWRFIIKCLPPVFFLFS